MSRRRVLLLPLYIFAVIFTRYGTSKETEEEKKSLEERFFRNQKAITKFDLHLDFEDSEIPVMANLFCNKYWEQRTFDLNLMNPYISIGSNGWSHLTVYFKLLNGAPPVKKVQFVRCCRRKFLSESRPNIPNVEVLLIKSEKKYCMYVLEAIEEDSHTGIINHEVCDLDLDAIRIEAIDIMAGVGTGTNQAQIIKRLEEQFDANRAKIKAFPFWKTAKRIVGLHEFCEYYFSQRAKDLQLPDHLKPIDVSCFNYSSGITIRTRIPSQGSIQCFDHLICEHYGSTEVIKSKVTIMKSAMPNCVYGFSVSLRFTQVPIHHQTCHLPLGEDEEEEKQPMILESDVDMKEKQVTSLNSKVRDFNIQSDSDTDEYVMVEAIQ